MDKFFEFWNGLGSSHQVMMCLAVGFMVLGFIFMLILLYGGGDDKSPKRD